MSDSGAVSSESDREVVVSWLSMMRTARAPIAVCVVVGAALLLLPQMRDMLDSIKEDTLNHPWAGFEYHACLWFFALSAWFWSRAVLAARFRIRDNTDLDGPNAPRRSQKGFALDILAFKTVPRFLFLGIAVCSAVAAWKKSHDVPDAVITVAWALVTYVWLEHRRTLVSTLRNLMNPPTGPEPTT